MYSTEATGWVPDDDDDDVAAGEKSGGAGEDCGEQDATLQIRRFQKRQVKVTYHQETEDMRGDNCCERFLRCLSHVPCGSLISWILLVLGLGALTGSLLIGTQKCRDLLKMESFLWMMEYSVIGVVVSMLVLGTCFLIAGHLSTDPTSRRLFNSSSKNRCARGFNIFLLGLVYVLCLVWVLASTALATPIVLLALMYLTTGDTLDLKYYGFPHYPDSPISGQELTNFKEDAMDVLICYGVSLLSAILVVISLVHFLICISANITHLKDNRFATLNAYETEELRNSKHSVLDTNM
ncbi:neuronal membrane glycoprotein M6-a-like isoform X2 [Babylonia areolata]|uniref:neuronal membrane glycoprotein M6-a-like isoform X2 n=1 Tax=Babylonia areolata TaxID=304850 RepID=UPI003FD16508